MIPHSELGQRHKDLYKIGTKGRGLLKAFRGFSAVALRVTDLTELVNCRGIIGIQCQLSFKLTPGLFKCGRFMRRKQQHATAPKMQIDGVGILRDGLGVFGSGLREVALCLKDLTRKLVHTIGRRGLVAEQRPLDVHRHDQHRCGRDYGRVDGQGNWR